MLYTRKGDDGKTRTFGCKDKVSKASHIAEALGSCDEVNSFLGLVKVKASSTNYSLLSTSFPDIIHWIQEGLFIVQAELAGAEKSITEERVKKVEEYTDTAEKELPPIKTFFISGGTELAALCDVSRTMVRRAERRVIAAADQGGTKVSDNTKAFLNRLSSLLYALARLSNHKSGINERPPTYE